MSELLKPCPFCGGQAYFAVSDDEGNPRPESYEDDPWSGLSFKIMHYYEENKECPIANYQCDKEGQGVQLYDSRQQAAAVWNTRKGEEA